MKCCIVYSSSPRVVCFLIGTPSIAGYGGKTGEVGSGADGLQAYFVISTFLCLLAAFLWAAAICRPSSEPQRCCQLVDTSVIGLVLPASGGLSNFCDHRTGGDRDHDHVFHTYCHKWMHKCCYGHVNEITDCLWICLILENEDKINIPRFSNLWGVIGRVYGCLHFNVCTVYPIE